ncbi:DUF4129 domain-containing protein [Sedimenticola selenatireducens]|uniref:DUF4129 domain-containing protein n=1 Tax=Sedimenticola selenatireducens TaxID=191960 RepID=A0A557S076_9GAMM|nr:DUF4129 domain-containing protein [Sedimenticola selenatireducens]TVO70817.1 DUF4129 domain-containing protein [Sedimenticola selenatireducens]TVT65737.1 MAG: DUF4129 domain-containing protein [Sedimenticola selenatireducens]
MELDKIAVKVRPRTPWEAIDLGFTMARAWFLPLWLLWMAVALPVYLLAVLLLPDEPVWVILIFWWCKPMYEPMLLFWMSRALFGERVSLSSVLKRGWNIVWPQLLNNLTWRRLNLNRSFSMPVSVLEGLKGKARKKRIAVLGRGQQGSVWLTIVGAHFEIALEVSCILLIVVMLPEELQWLDIDAFLLQPGNLEQWLQHVGDILAMSLIAPFYVAGGFGLYLTRRTELEAWDIEIDFRQLMNRASKQKAAAPTLAIISLLSVMFVGLFFTPSYVEAETLSRDQAKSHIEAVLTDEVFGKKKVITYWNPIDKEKSDADLGWLMEWILSALEGFTQGFAAFGKGVLLVTAGFLLAWLIYKALANRGEWAINGRGKAKSISRPVTLFGLAMDTESLPPDITAECQRLVNLGQIRAALSLLYRGALVALLEQDQLEVPGSATEQECLELVQANCPGPLSDFFAVLTPVWIQLAYDHQTPSEDEVVAFCNHWDRLFGGVVKHAD